VLVTTTTVWDLELPTLDTEGLDRLAALDEAAKLGQQSWLARTDIGFSVLHYDDAVSILRDRRFHSALSLIRRNTGGEVQEYFSGRRPSILSMEGDEHLRLRRLVSPAFTPGAADRHRPVMHRVFSELFEPMLANGGGDFVAEVCEPYPIPIICEVLGAPREDWRQFSQWATGIFKLFNGNLDRDLKDIREASAALEVYVRALVAERRRDPRDDLLSDLIAMEEEGDRLSTDEMVMLAEAVLMAGTDTTRNQLGCALALFAQHPEQWQKLIDDPTLVPKAVEEVMRRLGAVRATVRIAIEDVVVHDVVFPKGTAVTTHFGAGNRDEAAFSNPDEFDITAARTNQQLTFGSGVHRCLGAALARAELQVALGYMLERVATVELAGPVGWKPSTNGIWGPSSLPLRLTARS
jgi:cytochrome P450